MRPNRKKEILDGFPSGIQVMPDLKKRFPKIAEATIRRNLIKLVNQGKMKKLDINVEGKKQNAYTVGWQKI